MIGTIVSKFQWFRKRLFQLFHYRAGALAKSTRYPWEKKKIQVLSSIERPSQVQRDYNRIIPEIGTPAPFPKPRGKSPSSYAMLERPAEANPFELISRAPASEISPKSSSFGKQKNQSKESTQ